MERKLGTGVMPFFTVNDGEAATQLYTWIKYADDEYGTNMSNSPLGKYYMGIASNKEGSIPTNNPKDYIWSRFVGDQGSQGIQGPEGPMGNSKYTWVKYADDHFGNGMSDNSEDKKYIGIATNKDTEVESDDPKDYQWSRFVGEEAAAIYLTGETQVITIDSNGAVAPEKPFKVSGFSKKTKIVDWKYSVNGGEFKGQLPRGFARNDDEVTIYPNMVVDKIISIRASDGILSDTFTIAVTKDGAHGSGFTILLSNEAHNFPGTEHEALPSVCEVDVLMFFGSQSTAPTSIEVIDAPYGLTHHIDGNRIYFGTTPDMEASGMATILVKSGKQAFTRYFSYAVAYSGPQGVQGEPGDTGISYKLILDTDTIILNKDLTFSPEYVNIKSMQFVGVEEVAKPYISNIVISYLDKKLGEWIEIENIESEDTILNPRLDATAYKIDMISLAEKKEGDTSKVLDSQTITVIQNTDEIREDTDQNTEDIEKNTEDIEQNTNDIEETNSKLTEASKELAKAQDKIDKAKEEIAQLEKEFEEAPKYTFGQEFPTNPREGDLFYKQDSNGVIVAYYIFKDGSWELGFARPDPAEMDKYYDEELIPELDRIDRAIGNVNTELGEWQKIVGDKADKSTITQLQDDINARVEKDGIINQINISSEGVLIDGEKIRIEGNTIFSNLTRRDGGITKIDGGMIATNTISANEISVGTLSALSSNLGQIYGGSLNIGNRFEVNSSGYLTATGATITGEITATSGTFTGEINATSGTFTGTVNARGGTIIGDMLVSGTLKGATIEAGHIIGARDSAHGAVLAFGEWIGDDGPKINHSNGAIRLANDQFNYIRVSGFNLAFVSSGKEVGNFNSDGLYVSKDATIVGDLTVRGNASINGQKFTSARELKKNIEPFSCSLGQTAIEKVVSTPVYKYNYIDDEDTDWKYTGVIIDEAPAEIVNMDGKNINIYSMVSVLWKAVQEQQEEIDRLKKS